jgi:hypothetical protein
MVQENMNLIRKNIDVQLDASKESWFIIKNNKPMYIFEIKLLYRDG